jgi:hypothetical protein
MVTPDSRYANLGESTFRAPDGKVAVYLRRRFVPDPSAVRGSPVAAQRGERIDVFASREIGSPMQFYRICDASGLDDPFAVAESPQPRLYLPGGYG